MISRIQDCSFRLVAAICAAALLLSFTNSANATSRIKDMVSVEGVRDNQLVGYGLVVGLDGTGDTLQNIPFARQTIEAMLERLGINTRDAAQMRTENVATVMVTANMGSFSRQGSRMDVIVSSVGDAEALRGGTLLVTPLYGADGEVYAVAQGSVAVAGFAASGDAASIVQGVPTSGRIANGAIIEREINFEFADLNSVNLSLNNPDFTTSRRIANAINGHMGIPVARSIDPATVLLSRPVDGRIALLDLITDIEHLPVTADLPARVLIDDRSGIIVMGANVKLNSIAIAQGNLTIRITEQPQVSQPAPFSDQGQTTVVPRTQVEVDTDDNRRLTVMETGVTLHELVDGLNALGVGPRDMISILQAIKQAGAMQATLEIM